MLRNGRLGSEGIGFGCKRSAFGQVDRRGINWGTRCVNVRLHCDCMVDDEENLNHTVAWYAGDYTEICIVEARRRKVEHRCPKR